MSDARSEMPDSGCWMLDPVVPPLGSRRREKADHLKRRSRRRSIGRESRRGTRSAQTQSLANGPRPSGPMEVRVGFWNASDPPRSLGGYGEWGSKIGNRISGEGVVPPTPYIHLRTLCEVAGERRHGEQSAMPHNFGVRWQSGASTPLSRPGVIENRPATPMNRRMTFHARLIRLFPSAATKKGRACSNRTTGCLRASATLDFGPGSADPSCCPNWGKLGRISEKLVVSCRVRPRFARR